MRPAGCISPPATPSVAGIGQPHHCGTGLPRTRTVARRDRADSYSPVTDRPGLQSTGWFSKPVLSATSAGPETAHPAKAGAAKPRAFAYETAIVRMAAGLPKGSLTSRRDPDVSSLLRCYRPRRCHPHRPGTSRTLRLRDNLLVLTRAAVGGPIIPSRAEPRVTRRSCIGRRERRWSSRRPLRAWPVRASPAAARYVVGVVGTGSGTSSPFGSDAFHRPNGLGGPEATLSDRGSAPPAPGR